MKNLLFKRFLSLFVFLCCSFGFAQNDFDQDYFDYSITDGNMIVQISNDVLDAVMDDGDIIGAFFTNDSNELQCGGAAMYASDQLAVAVWKAEGSDNGFDAGEALTWIMYDASDDVNINLDAEMNTSGIFTDVFENNGFGQVLSFTVAVESDCNDDDAAMAPFGCATAITAFTCSGEWNGMTIADACPESCDNCATCEDDDDAMAPFGCATAITAFTCSGEWNGMTIADACPESCDACGGDSGPVL